MSQRDGRDKRDKRDLAMVAEFARGMSTYQVATLFGVRVATVEAAIRAAMKGAA